MLLALLSHCNPSIRMHTPTPELWSEMQRLQQGVEVARSPKVAQSAQTGGVSGCGRSGEAKSRSDTFFGIKLCRILVEKGGKHVYNLAR